MEIPRFAESSHPLVQSLSQRSDRELVALFERYPHQGRYFTTLFCRYSSTIYVLVAPTVAPSQVRYLHRLTWRRIFAQMQERKHTVFDSFQDWLIHTASTFIQQPGRLNHDVLDINKAIAPPLYCYVERTLEQLPPMQRFVLVMADKFDWQEQQIAQYLPSELTIEDVRSCLEKGHQALKAGLPEDICQIYL